MATATWIDGTANWTVAADWSTGTVPGADDDAVIPFGTVSLTAPVTIKSVTLSTSAAILKVTGTAVASTLTGNLANSGTLTVDASAPGGTLSVAAALINSGMLSIGADTSLAGPTTVQAASVANTGTIKMGKADGGAGQATLSIAAAAPATLTGTYNLLQNALLQFASGGIAAIANGASLTIAAQSAVGISGSGGNSALTGLTSNAGTLSLSVQTLNTNSGVDFTNTGNFEVGGSGSSITLGGTLNNSGTVTVARGVTMTVAGLNNTGSINIFGQNSFQSGGQATLNVLGSAPEILTGSIRIHGYALLNFTNGSINTIASGALLEIASYATLPAQVIGLSGLTSNAGTLSIDPQLGGGVGGTNISINGTLSNSGTIGIGSFQLIRASSSLTVGGLNNTGSITLKSGSDIYTATLDVQDAAPTTLTGTVNVGRNSLLKYASGGITAIASGAALNLDSTGVVALSSNTGGNTALSGLASNAGTLSLRDHAALATSSGVEFVNSGTVAIELGVLALGGTLTNSGNFMVADVSTVTVNGTANNAGTVVINAPSNLVVTGGNPYTQSAGSTNVGGALSAAAVTVTGGTLLFSTALTASAGTGGITLSGGGLVEFAAAVDSSEIVGFAGPGTLKLDAANSFAGTIARFTGPAEVVDLPGLASATHPATVSFDDATDRLTVTGDSSSVTLQLDDEDYSGVAFLASQDGTGGTKVFVDFGPPLAYSDFNADTLSDLAFQTLDNRFLVSLSTSTRSTPSFASAQQWAAEGGGGFVAGQAQYADVNGDGRDDLIYQGIDNLFWLAPSNGTGFTQTAGPPAAVEGAAALSPGRRSTPMSTATAGPT